MFDKRGTGLSDRVGELPALDERMDDARAVMDAVGMERAALLGVSEGGPLAVLFAATYPDAERWCSMAPLRASRPGFRRKRDFNALFEYIDQAWGTGGSSGDLRAVATERSGPTAMVGPISSRLGASPAAGIALMRMNSQIDISDILSSVHVPTLVIHIAGDKTVSVEGGRLLAEHIPGARLLELPGDDHLFFIHEQTAARITDAVAEFLTGSVATTGGDRVLRRRCLDRHCGLDRPGRAIGRPALARSSGRRHHKTVRRELARSRGNEVKSLGDGFLATFDTLARAVRCARAISEAVDPLGIQVRSGLHTGEVEVAAHEVQGIAVHIASRVAALAGPGEVLVSRTVRDLVAGSGLLFDDRGRHLLKGLREPMDIYAVSN